MRLPRRRFNLFALLAASPLRGGAVSTLEAPIVAEILGLTAFALFPHGEISQASYDALVATFIDADPNRASKLAEELGGQEYLAATPSARVERMQARQDLAAFQALRFHVLMGLYTDLEVTRHFGYEGPSFAQGGYLERGFDNLRWVPEPGDHAR